MESSDSQEEELRCHFAFLSHTTHPGLLSSQTAAISEGTGKRLRAECHCETAKAVWGGGEREKQTWTQPWVTSEAPSQPWPGEEKPAHVEGHLKVQCFPAPQRDNFGNADTAG